jgi:hypothetical protein
VAAVTQDATELRDVRLDYVGRGPRRTIAPHAVDQAIARNDAVRMKQKDREHRSLLRPAQRHPSSAVADLERPEHQEIHFAPVPILAPTLTPLD